MNENKAESMDLEFKIVFKGYSVTEVNEYIALLRSEIEDIRKENGELYRKLDFYSTEMESYRTDEETRRQLIQQAQEEAEEIIKEAKKQAAKEVLRGNRLCSRMVADMVSQVEEQKKLFIATKTEAANYRRELFERYRVHIELINAMSEATGVFDGNEITDTELEDLKRLMENPELTADSEKQTADGSQHHATEEGTSLFMDAFSDTASFGAVAAPLKNKKNKGRRSLLNSQDKNADKKKGTKAPEKETAAEENKQSEKESAGESKAPVGEGGKSIRRMRKDVIYGEKEMFEEFSAPHDIPQAEPLPEAAEISAVISEIENSTSTAADGGAPVQNTPAARPERPENAQTVTPAVRPERPENAQTVAPAVRPENAQTVAPAVRPENAQTVAPAVRPERPERTQGKTFAAQQRPQVKQEVQNPPQPVEAEGNKAFTITDEDLEEFGNPDGPVMEYDSPVSVESVFKKNPYNDKDFDLLYGEDDDYESSVDVTPKRRAIPPEELSEPAERKFNSYGFDVSNIERYDPDDDSDEFYMENDAEYDPGATEGVPTGTVSAFSISEQKTAPERRWRVRRNKSVTDEFDVVRAEEEQ